MASFKAVTLHLLDGTKESQPPRPELKLGLSDSQE